MDPWPPVGGAVAVVSLFCVVSLSALQDQPAAGPPQARPVVVTADRHDTSPPLRSLPPLPERAADRQPHPPLPLRGGPPVRPSQPDPAIQTAPPAGSLTATSSFEGLHNLNAVLPPDTNGDVGPSHYVQWVNLSFAVYDKSTGAALVGPVDGRTLWQGFGGACERRNDGDPIALYDEMSDRWLLSQFALPTYPFGPFYQCIAISKTGDPTGEYHRYQFSFQKMNDYPKFGVWPDAYYMSMNQFASGSLRWAGQGVVAYERERMLQGLSARMIYFDLHATDANLGGMLPSDLDGTLPPAGSPNYFMQVDDDAWGYSPDQLQIWKFHVDWTTTESTTFTRYTTLATAGFDSNMCGYARSCIPQPNTTAKLDALSDRLMYRLQYRNLGTGGERLVVNHTVDVGSDLAGIRWYEIQDPGGNASIRQQSTYAPGTDHYWMGSAAMDGAGNIALGYNVSSGAVVFPSIRFTARLSGDPLNQMTQGDNDLYQGTGSQTHSASRWGDYSSLSVDPTDNCTFWFTTEYYAATTSASWRTRIGSFKLPGCGAAAAPPAAPSGLSASASSTSAIDLQWTDNSSDESGFKVERCGSSDCSSAAEIAQTAAGATTYSDSGLAAGTAYWYRVRAFNSAGNSSYSNIASAATMTEPPTPPPAPTMSVAGLSGTSASSKKNWRATVSVAVGAGDNLATPVAGATVTGSWSNGASGSASCTTTTSGQCSVQSPAIKNNTASVTFTVNGITHASYTYDPSANVASSIAVSRQ